MATTPEEYIAALDEPRRSEIQTLYEAIRAAAPDLEPFMIANKIGFGRFNYKGKSGCAGEWFKLGLSSNKKTIMFATCAIVDGKNLSDSYVDRMPRADFGKSCINFKKFEDVDLDVVKEIAVKTAEADFSRWGSAYD